MPLPAENTVSLGLNALISGDSARLRVLVWIAAAILIAIFVVIALARLAIDIIGTHESPE
jgi:ABC-type maltose transport system permease subunit